MSGHEQIPEGLSDNEERDFLFQLNRERLAVMAASALNKGLKHDEFVMTLIDVDDSTWRPIVEQLMPGHDWQSYRDRGEKPISRGSAMASPLLSILSALVPDVETALTANLPEDLIKTIVMGRGGASVYLIKPTEQ